MATLKFQDVREVVVTVSNGSESGFVEFAPVITDQDGVLVAPDTVITEIVNSSGSSNFPASIITTRTGTSLRIYIFKAVNATGNDQTYTVRVTSLRWHSIQGYDHTI